MTKINITKATDKIWEAASALDDINGEELSQFSLDQLNHSVGVLEEAAAELRVELRRCKDAFER
jgi:hypothetical protein